MQLYLVRHGETNFNLEGRYYGWTDCSINETGKKQAMALKEKLASVPFDCIYTSTLKRTKETAKIIAGERNIPCIAWEGFRELHFGNWEGRSFQDIKENDKENCEKWWADWSHGQIPGGEAFQDFYQRVTEAFEQMKQECLDKNVLLVCHGGVIASLFCYLLGIATERFWSFRLGQGVYSHISVSENGIVIECVNK